ncbi:MAG: transposase [Kiritimatiellae bacterium]|nr:transposase [Kiritimatiellia bacterium]
MHHYHHYYGYDYSRGAVMFVTISTKPRQSVFSRINAGKAVPTEFGLMTLRELKITTLRVPEVKLSRYVLMPDHLHLLLWIKPGHEDGLARLGRFVGGFKRAVRQRWKELGNAGPLWQEGYHDLICLDHDFIEGVTLYIGYNPLKWELMHAGKGLIPITEPLDTAWLPDGTYWKGIGRCDLLDGSRRLCAVRISRRLGPSLMPAAIARLRSALEKGFCLVSTFLSPGERALYRMLSEEGAEFVHIKGTAIPVVYRPSIHETPLFAAQKLLVIGRQTDEHEVRRKDCLALNDAIAKMAIASGGTAVYVREDGRFDFHA